MVEYKKGNLLTAKDVNLIGHQTNCLGVMGAGIAKDIRKRYPVCYTAYKNLCDVSKEKLLGSVQFIDCGPVVIANMFGQLNIGEGVQTNYDALRNCIQCVHQKAKEENKVVGLPFKIGCGLAGGDWSIVKEMIENIFCDEVVCKVYSLQNMNIDAAKDGIDHINIYSQGKTQLGQMLSNFYKFPIVSKYYGNFNSVEGLWYYMSIEPCPEREELRKMYGFNAKKVGKELLKTHPAHFEENFENKILDAIWYKFKANYKMLTPDLYDLPFYHYYDFKGNIVDVTGKYDWMVNGIDKMRTRLISLIKARSNSVYSLLTEQINPADNNLVAHIYNENGSYVGSYYLQNLAKPADEVIKKITLSEVVSRTYVFDGFSSTSYPGLNDICIKIKGSDLPASNNFPKELISWNLAMDYISKTMHLHN